MDSQRGVLRRNERCGDTSAADRRNAQRDGPLAMSMAGLSELLQSDVPWEPHGERGASSAKHAEYSMDRPHNAKGRDGDFIDLGDAYQVDQWTEIFDVTRDDLAKAVREVGTSMGAVRKYIREAKKRRGA
jgi:Protein of unknown function (DUF3606)